MFELLLVLHYVLFSVYVLANKFDLIWFEPCQLGDGAVWKWSSYGGGTDPASFRTQGVAAYTSRLSRSDWWSRAERAPSADRRV